MISNRVLNSTILIAVLLFSLKTYSQSGNAINITTTGTGISKNDAINDALRNALEQTYGGFISSKTNITNDELLDDEVVAITSGEIHDYELVSETKIEPGYAVTIVAKISQTGLNNFVTQSGGDAIIFDANVFSTKIKLQRLNETAELKSINNILEILEEIYNRSIEFEFTSSNPKINENNGKWRVDFTVSTKYNENILSFINYFSSSLEKIAMTKSQKAEYDDLGKSTYPILVNNEFYYFRNESSYNSIHNFLDRLLVKFSQFKITMNNGDYIYSPSINKRTLYDYIENFFIPYLNFTPRNSYNNRPYDNLFLVGLRKDGEFNFREYTDYYYENIDYEYIVQTKGYKGQPSTLNSVPKEISDGGILMLNKDNKINITSNPSNSSVWIGEIQGDGGLIFAGGETLFMYNLFNLNFKFKPNNYDTVFVDEKELSIDEYLSKFKKEGSLYSRTFTGDLSNMRWSNDRKIVNLNELNISKKKEIDFKKELIKKLINNLIVETKHRLN